MRDYTSKKYIWFTSVRSCLSWKENRSDSLMMMKNRILYLMKVDSEWHKFIYKWLKENERKKKKKNNRVIKKLNNSFHPRKKRTHNRWASREQSFCSYCLMNNASLIIKSLSLVWLIFFHCHFLLYSKFNMIDRLLVSFRLTPGRKFLKQNKKRHRKIFDYS